MPWKRTEALFTVLCTKVAKFILEINKKHAHTEPRRLCTLLYDIIDDAFNWEATKFMIPTSQVRRGLRCKLAILYTSEEIN